MKITKYTTLLLTLLLCLFVACDESTDINKEQQSGATSEPIITSFAPQKGAPGTEVKVQGEHLNYVTNVTIGGQIAKIKHRVSENEIVVEVTANAKSGAIVLENSKGTGTSQAVFAVEVVVPQLEAVATETANEMTIGEVVTITGENLKSVSRVLIGAVESVIQFASDNELRFIVPLADAGKKVGVVLEYMSGESATTVESSDLYLIKRSSDSPTITQAPQSALIFTTVELKGMNMNTIDKVKLGNKEVDLVVKTETAVTFVVPSVYGEETILDLIVMYNGDQEALAVKDFKIEVPAISTDVYFVGAMVLGAEGTSSADAKHFVSSLNGGTYYEACGDIATLDANTDFYITSYSDASTIQLNNPNNSATQAVRFLCDGVKVPLLDKKLTNVVKYRVLNSSSGVQNAYIKQVKERTLGKITPEIVKAAGIADATTSTPRYGTTFNIGDVVMFNRFDSKGVVPLGVGFMEIVDVELDVANLATTTMTVHCFFQK